MAERAGVHPGVWSRLQSEVRRELLAHALLFVGPAGIGRSETAWRLAEQLLQRRLQRRPTDTQEGKQSFLQDGADFFYVQPLGGILRIVQIRELQQALAYTAEGRRVVVLAGAERINEVAANALLKTLEEPTPGTYFILLSETDRLLPTILSRVTKYSFAAWEPAAFAEALGTVAPGEAELLYQVTDGNPGAAGRILEGGIAASAAAATELLAELTEGRTPYFTATELWRKVEREENMTCLRWLYLLVRDLAVLRAGAAPETVRCRFAVPELERWQRRWLPDALTEFGELIVTALAAERLYISDKLIGDMLVLRGLDLRRKGYYANRSRGTL
ncbi:MAG: hypothetical protein MR209_04830 [Veillonellaceae bacterium]|nr:hypothetical protein [Veillonellaceae bacterium]